jgi:hypothetical protein
LRKAPTRVQFCIADAAEFEDHVQRIQDWQDAAFDALEKGYLRTMMFGVYDANMTQLLESYVCEYLR